MRIKRSIVVLITCIATLVAGLLVLNFSPGEKKIDTQLTRLYDTDDPQFRRSLGVLLGPPIIEGNKYIIGPVRRALLKHFPYFMYFSLNEDHVSVIAVVHQRRDHTVWMDRGNGSY